MKWVTFFHSPSWSLLGGASEQDLGGVGVRDVRGRERQKRRRLTSSYFLVKSAQRRPSSGTCRHAMPRADAQKPRDDKSLACLKAV